MAGEAPLPLGTCRHLWTPGFEKEHAWSKIWPFSDKVFASVAILAQVPFRFESLSSEPALRAPAPRAPSLSSMPRNGRRGSRTAAATPRPPTPPPRWAVTELMRIETYPTELIRKKNSSD